MQKLGQLTGIHVGTKPLKRLEYLVKLTKDKMVLLENVVESDLFPSLLGKSTVNNMTEKVGNITNLGSVINAKMNNLKSNDIDGKFRDADIGHKGQEGSNPYYSDTRDHIVTCVAVDVNNVATRRCSCGLIWTYDSTKFNTMDPIKSPSKMDFSALIDKETD